MIIEYKVNNLNKSRYTGASRRSLLHLKNNVYFFEFIIINIFFHDF